MAEEGLKGKSKRIRIMKIIDTVGYNKSKIKIALLRSTIKERINHEWYILIDENYLKNNRIFLWII